MIDENSPMPGCTAIAMEFMAGETTQFCLDSDSLFLSGGDMRQLMKYRDESGAGGLPDDKIRFYMKQVCSNS